MPVTLVPPTPAPGLIPPGREPIRTVLTSHWDGPAIGALCAGCGNLELAIADALGGYLAWVSSRHLSAALLKERFPDTPALDDAAPVDWASVPPVDAITSGLACHAGIRADTRPHAGRCTWDWGRDAIATLTPGLVFAEDTVAGLAAIVADLHDLGYWTRWARPGTCPGGSGPLTGGIYVLAWQPGAFTRMPARRRTCGHHRRYRVICRPAGPPRQPAFPGPCRRARHMAAQAEAAVPGTAPARDQVAVMLRLLIASARPASSGMAGTRECERPRMSRIICRHGGPRCPSRAVGLCASGHQGNSG
jgi:hypothetical protein